MNTGAPILFGQAGSSSASAAGPPVETPISTMGAPVRPRRTIAAPGTAGASHLDGWLGFRPVVFRMRADLALARQGLDHRPQTVAQLRQALFPRPSFRLGDEIESSGFERVNRHLAALDSQRAEHDHDWFFDAACAHRLQHLNAVHLRHFDVERDQVWRSAAMRASASLPFDAVPTTSTSGYVLPERPKQSGETGTYRQPPTLAWSSRLSSRFLRHGLLSFKISLGFSTAMTCPPARHTC